MNLIQTGNRAKIIGDIYLYSIRQHFYTRQYAQSVHLRPTYSFLGAQLSIILSSSVDQNIHGAPCLEKKTIQESNCTYEYMQVMPTMIEYITLYRIGAVVHIQQLKLNTRQVQETQCVLRSLSKKYVRVCRTISSRYCS